MKYVASGSNGWGESSPSRRHCRQLSPETELFRSTRSSSHSVLAILKQKFLW